MPDLHSRQLGRKSANGLAVYVPSDVRLVATIRTGSGLVGSPENGRVMVDYEGAIYDQPSMARFADRVAHAAGRHVESYPTTARIWVKPEVLTRVGTWNDLDGEVRLSPGAEPALAAWLGVPRVPAHELQATGARYEKRRAIKAALASGDPVQIANARMYARREHIDDLA